jgi:excisionase family DNA binding protein
MSAATAHGAATLPDERLRTNAPGKVHSQIISDLPEVLQVEQVAAVFGVSQQVARHLLRSGQLPGRRIGRRWYVPRAQLAAFLSGGDGA